MLAATGFSPPGKKRRRRGRNVGFCTPHPLSGDATQRLNKTRTVLVSSCRRGTAAGVDQQPGSMRLTGDGETSAALQSLYVSRVALGTCISWDDRGL